MNYCIRTNSLNEDFRKLVTKLDAYLKICDGKEHLFYAQLNKTEDIKNVVISYDDGQPIGCGAVREYSYEIMEVKRMYVLPHKRGQGIASSILKELELWTVELNFKKCILETGKNQPEAIQFYKKNGYNIIPSYGHYLNIENSVCFEKMLENITMDSNN